MAMIAKKRAAVAVWIRVWEFQKLLTTAPVARSAWEPASTLRRAVTSTTTTTSPASWEATRLRASARMAGWGITRAEPLVGRLIGAVRLRIGVFRRRPGERAPHRRGEVGKRPGPHRGEQRGAVRRSLLAIHRAHRQSIDLGLEPPDERTPGAAPGQEQLGGPEPEPFQDRQRIAEREAHPLEHRAGQVGAGVGQAQPEKGPARCTRGCA